MNNNKFSDDLDIRRTVDDDYSSIPEVALNPQEYHGAWVCDEMEKEREKRGIYQ